MQTSYLLHIFLDQQTHIRIGKLGKFDFPRGHYFYVGSARKHLKQRIARHLANEKRFHWHIDYLLRCAKIANIWATEIPEEELAFLISRYLTISVKGFGSSDKKSISHLFYNQKELPMTHSLFDQLSIYKI